MKILGISAWYHDSAAALIVDGKIVAAAQEERFTRKKHDASFPANAVKFCLEESGLSPSDLDAVAFYDKPLLKFERLLETYYAWSPRGLASFAKAMPVWLDEKLFLKRNIRKELRKIGAFETSSVKLLFPEHHLSHAASAFYPSPFSSAAILTVDGVGEWATASIYKGEGNAITAIKEMQFPHSLGLLYSAFTYWLGFTVNSGEYKLMGLAPYGIPDSANVKRYESVIKSNLANVNDDGSVWLNQKYFTYATGLRMVSDTAWESLFGFPRRDPKAELNQNHCDLGMAIQNITEEVILKMAREAKRITGEERICLSGGVALNCVANGKLLESKEFKEIFIQPASGDAGGAVGAALAAYHIYFEKERISNSEHDSLEGSYLGPEFSSKQIEGMILKRGAVASCVTEESQLMRTVAEFLAEGNVVGWFQGRMEFGPRALGNRSILGDPRNEEMQKKMNLKIKYRESFRPFAPSVPEERTAEYFNLQSLSPYMLLVAPVRSEHRLPVPDNYYTLPMMERLYVKRSPLPAITHIDFSARVQSVQKRTNPRYYNLLNAFGAKTGTYVLVNTSFNVRGEPIVCTPDDAYRCFMRTEMDYLVIGDYIFDKKLQPKSTDSDAWKEEFQPD